MGWRSQGHARRAQTPHDCNADVELKETEWTDVEGNPLNIQIKITYVLLLGPLDCRFVTNMGWRFWTCCLHDKQSTRWQSIKMADFNPDLLLKSPFALQLNPYPGPE